MSEFRTYTCLACADRPVFHGKIGAAMHLRSAHYALLEDHHPDELLAEGPEYVQPEKLVGPFLCIFRDANGEECGQRRADEWGMGQHIISSHHVDQGEIEHGRQYLTEAEYQDRARRLYDQAIKPLTPQQEWWAKHFGQAVSSLRGVADFLTECRA